MSLRALGFSPRAVGDRFINKFQGRQPLVRRILGQYSSLQAALLVLVIYNIDEFYLEVRIFGPL